MNTRSREVGCYNDLIALTSLSIARLSRCLSNFRVFGKVPTRISLLWVFTRSCDKTSVRLVNRDPYFSGRGYIECSSCGCRKQMFNLLWKIFNSNKAFVSNRRKSLLLPLFGVIYYIKVDSRFALSQSETAFFCNDVSHCLGTNLESALYMVYLSVNWAELTRFWVLSLQYTSTWMYLSNT